MRWSYIIFFLLALSAGINSSAQRDKKIRNKTSKKENRETDTTVLIVNTYKLAQYNVAIRFTHYYPYCGGAYPDEAEMNNYQLQTNTTFNLVNLSDKSKTKIMTDSLGYLKVFLPPGRYGIQELFKDCSFDEFYGQYKSKNNDMYTEDEGVDCYRRWWSSMLIEFEITESTTIFTGEATTFSACFTGDNPCLTYFGPYPP